MNKLLPLLAAIAIGSYTEARADFFEPGEYEGSSITLGARVGINTSNMAGDDYAKKSALDSWGTGFDGGVVANINFRDWIAVQPGFFFQSRSNNFSYIYDNTVIAPSPERNTYIEYGHRRHTMFKVPVMCVVRFHPFDRMVWSVEAGPVFNFGLGGHEWVTDPLDASATEHRYNYFDRFNRFMMGLKMGTGMEFFGHYYVGIHYEAGLRSAMKYSAGGHDKAWSFSIGYNF